MKDAIFDALLDTLYVFISLLIIYFILSFVESKLSKSIEKSNHFSPVFGASIGLIPQCGFSIVASDLYRKKYISIGTLIAVFVACSDEAIPIMLSQPNKILYILLILGIKFIVGLSCGYLIDFIYKKQQIRIHSHNLLIHKGCCHHDIEVDENETFVKKHIIHPLLHSLKICAYVLVINIGFAILFYYFEEPIKNFLLTNIYLTPLLTCFIGLIPNCASSVIITELYLNNSITFAACIAGLICNAGLGLVYLFKDKYQIKNSLLITGILVLIGILVGYITLFIELI